MDIVEPDPIIEALELAKKAYEGTRSTSMPAPRGEAGGSADLPVKSVVLIAIRIQMFVLGKLRLQLSFLL